MEPYLEELYQRAKRFDEGEIYQSEEYGAIARKQRVICERMRNIYGDKLWAMLMEYTEAVSEEIDLECRHFFARGYAMGKGDK